MLAVLFGAAAGEAPDERLPSQLLSNLAQLRARAEAYDRMPGTARPGAKINGSPAASRRLFWFAWPASRNCGRRTTRMFPA